MMMSAALRSPAENANLIINEGLVQLGIRGSTGRNLKDLGLDINPNLIRIPARMLTAPQIQFGAGTRTEHPASASWRLGSRGAGGKVILTKFAKWGASPLKVGILRLQSHSSECSFNAQEFETKLRHSLKGHGAPVDNGRWPVHTAQIGALSVEWQNTVPSTLNAFYRENRGLSAYLIIIPQQNQDLYAIIKKVGDYHGLNTICHCLEVANRVDDQTMSNLALKFCLKSEGFPSKLVRPPQITWTGGDSRTLILGADVTHPGPAATKGCPSIAAVVGNLDEHCVRYGGSMRLQRSRQEIIDDLKDMVLERLRQYYSINKHLPQKIIYYRDGVSEVQYEEVRSTELEQIIQAHKEAQAKIASSLGQKLSACAEPKLTCLVVGKRHHTRFYPTLKNQAIDVAKNGNMNPGLVVDSVITHPTQCDFFLQSHAAIKGTARSAHYFLLRDDNAFTTDRLQQITHSLCYTYGPATKGISYCAPAYLADKLCDRGRQYLRDLLLNRQNHGFVIPEQEKGESTWAWGARVANAVGSSAPYLIHGGVAGRRNPWHPSLDGRMFWV